MRASDKYRLTICSWLLLLLGAAAGPAPARAQKAEPIIPLGPAKVRELAGEASAEGPQAPPRPLRPGDQVSAGQKVQTGATAHLELGFADGTLLRIGPSAAVTLLPQLRRVALHRGRVLVAADRMIGGLAVLTRRAALLPEGTTYLVETTDSGDEVMVLEGVVCACTVSPAAAAAPPLTAPAPTPPPTHDQMVLPGEALTLTLSSAAASAGTGAVRPPPAAGSDKGKVKELKLFKMSRPLPRRLFDVLKTEPLIVAFAQPLPSLRVITDHAVEQRRGVLTSRNERLRRELFWKRPPHAPVKLPDFFDESDSVIIRYVYPD